MEAVVVDIINLEVMVASMVVVLVTALEEDMLVVLVTALEEVMLVVLVTLVEAVITVEVLPVEVVIKALMMNKKDLEVML